MLLNKKILITGAARGLGEAFARACVAAGARVVITDILSERGHALAAELSQERADAVLYLDMDVSDSVSVKTAMAQAAAWLGGLDGVVNNAAITNSGGKAMGDIAEAMFDRVLSVNIKGTWLVTCAAQAHLAASGAGRVVNISSDTALWGAPNLMAYVASKGAIAAMTHSMAREMGAAGTTVNAIAPGLTLGESTDYVPQIRHDYYMQGRAIPRAQVPEDITAAVVFLLSDVSGFITGQVLPVNGGFVMK